MFHSKNPITTGGFQSNRVNCWLLFLLAARVRKIYIRAGVLNNVTAKIELSPQTGFFFKKLYPKKSTEHKN